MTHILKGNWAIREVWLDGKPLLPAKSQTLYNHSPNGFNWGYMGSGPSQLALAICLELWTDKATEMYQDFKRHVISVLPQSDIDVIIHENYKFI